MKHSVALIALFSLISLNVKAQKTTIWKGGTPGKPNEWYCPTNWKEGRQPDEFSHVIIPDVSTSTFSYPRIANATIVVASVQCMPGAKLELGKNARLVELDNPGSKPRESQMELAVSREKSDSVVLRLYQSKEK
ncbi:MAG TPA: hypothetical protein DCF33_15570 [Saprospirales bacterium]|nr:hypothetical protein [Saprospirales bacterium]